MSSEARDKDFLYVVCFPNGSTNIYLEDRRIQQYNPEKYIFQFTTSEHRAMRFPKAIAERWKEQINKDCDLLIKCGIMYSDPEGCKPPFSKV